MKFIINNQKIFQRNSSIHSINTRKHHHLNRPNGSLSCFHKSTFYADIKIFNSLPPSVTILKNNKEKFKAVLRKYLHTHFFYSVDEFFMCKDDLHYCYLIKCSILHCQFVQLCIYNLFHFLLSLWHTYGSMECTYICMCVCTYVMYVCMCVCTYVMYKVVQIWPGLICV